MIANIEYEFAIRLPFLRRDGGDIAAHDVIGHKSGHVYRIIGGAEGRRVRKVKILEIKDSHPAGDRGGQDVDSLVHAVFPKICAPSSRPVPSSATILIMVGFAPG